LNRIIEFKFLVPNLGHSGSRGRNLFWSVDPNILQGLASYDTSILLKYQSIACQCLIFVLSKGICEFNKPSAEVLFVNSALRGKKAG